MKQGIQVRPSNTPVIVPVPNSSANGHQMQLPAAKGIRVPKPVLGNGNRTNLPIFVRGQNKVFIRPAPPMNPSAVRMPVGQKKFLQQPMNGKSEHLLVTQVVEGP